MSMASARRPERTDYYELPIGDIELAPIVAQARLVAASQRARLEAEIQPRIDGHLLIYDAILDELVDAHTRVADSKDFGFLGQTRWAAVWELSGRCIALTRCVMAQLRAGFGSEAAPTLRSIHEATELLILVRGTRDGRLLRRWLDGEQIGAQKVRGAVHRLHRTELRASGVDVTAQHAHSKVRYDALSEAAHNTRSGFSDSISPELQAFAYGPHPDLVIRAVNVNHGGEVLEGVANTVGWILGTTFLGFEFLTETIIPIQERLKAIRTAMPINRTAVEDMRRQLSGL
jgi:hypothetical protein